MKAIFLSKFYLETNCNLGNLCGCYWSATLFLCLISSDLLLILSLPFLSSPELLYLLPLFVSYLYVSFLLFSHALNFLTSEPSKLQKPFLTLEFSIAPSFVFWSLLAVASFNIDSFCERLILQFLPVCTQSSRCLFS